MTTPNSMPIPDMSIAKDMSRPLDTPEMIDRLAVEMRVKSGSELPLSYCVEQVKRQLSGKSLKASAANDEPAQMKPTEQPSVFHAWALSE